jgi:uncharacterized membrane protein
MRQREARVQRQGATSTAAINGHPIHPMLVPFPIVFLTGTLLADIGYWISEDDFWARAALWLVGAGVVSGLLAAVVGAIDFFTIERARQGSTGWTHALGNVLAVGLSLISYFIRRGDPADSVLWSGLALSLVTVAILVVTGWLGGELAFRHRIGVIEEDQGSRGG